MTNNKKAILWIVLFAVFLAIAYFAYTALSENYTPDETPAPEESKTPETTLERKKIEAPDFAVYDAEGNTVKLSDFKGKPVVLNFWASWCGPCRVEMPDFDEVYADVKDDIVFMMVNLTDGQQETQASAQAYIDEQGYHFPIYFDIDRDAAYTYGISSIPSTLFIDSEGYVSNAYRGMISKETLEKEIDLIKP